MADIELCEVSKRYGDKQVLQNCSLCFPEHKITALLGASGTGKTTVLRLIAGLETPDCGEIRGIVPGGVAMAFQEPRLFPSMTALENLCCVLHGSMRANAARMRALLAEIGLEEAADRRADTLSGGMAARVAFLRALVADRPVTLLDEPFSGVDTANRDRMAAMLRRMTAGKTIILVSHIPEEVGLLADCQLMLQPMC